MATKSFNQKLVANGTSKGTVTVADSTGFEIGAIVFLSAKGEKAHKLVVAEKPNPTSVVVVTMDGAAFDASAFTVAKQAKLLQPKDELLNKQ